MDNAMDWNRCRSLIKACRRPQRLYSKKYRKINTFFGLSEPCRSIVASTTLLHSSLSLTSCSPSSIFRSIRSSLIRSFAAVLEVLSVWFSSYFNLLYCLALHSIYTADPAYPSAFENSHYVWLIKNWSQLCIYSSLICIILLVSFRIIDFTQYFPFEYLLLVFYHPTLLTPIPHSI